MLAGCALGCSDPVEPGDAGFFATPEGVEYRAWTDVMESYPVQLRVNVQITNGTGDEVDLTFPDGCVVLVRAYREGSTGNPAWDQSVVVGCTQAQVQLHLEPGERVSYASNTDAREILGDSLPDGQYRLEAMLRPSSGPVVIPAGTVTLSVPRNVSSMRD